MTCLFRIYVWMALCTIPAMMGNGIQEDRQGQSFKPDKASGWAPDIIPGDLTREHINALRDHLDAVFTDFLPHDGRTVKLADVQRAVVRAVGLGNAYNFSEEPKSPTNATDHATEAAADNSELSPRPATTITPSPAQRVAVSVDADGAIEESPKPAPREPSQTQTQPSPNQHAQPSPNPKAQPSPDQQTEARPQSQRQPSPNPEPRAQRHPRPQPRATQAPSPQDYGSGPMFHLCAPSTIPRVCGMLPLDATATIVEILTSNGQAQVTLQRHTEALFFRADPEIGARTGFVSPYDDVHSTFGEVLAGRSMDLSKGGYRHSNVIFDADSRDVVLDMFAGDTQEGAQGERETRSVSMWLSDEGLHTAARYDPAQTVFLQLHGRTRFILLPPQRITSTSMHPRLTPHGRHVRGNRPPTQDAITIDLEPGDILYLPPFWIYETVALEPALAVSITQPWGFGNITRTAASLPLPRFIFTMITIAKNDHIGQHEDYLFSHLAAYITHIGGGRHKFTQLASLRYGVKCTENLQQNPRCPALTKVTADIREAAEAKKELYESVPEPYRTVLVQDHAEDIVQRALGSDNTKFFFESCFVSQCSVYF